MTLNSSKLKRGNGLGFTLIEVTVAIFISSMFAILIMLVLIQSGWLMRTISNEVELREELGRWTRNVETSMRGAPNGGIRIYSAHNSVSTQAQYGSCVVITNPKAHANPVAYYYYNPGGTLEGGLYFDPNANTAPDPSNDELLSKRIVDFEIRRNNNGALRIGIVGDTRPPLEKGDGSKEGHRIRLTTSVIQRL